MTKTTMERALDDLRVAADVCELDENPTVVRQALRIRAARGVLEPLVAQAIEARRAATENTDAVHESAVGNADAPNQENSR